jgi:hypothetical protein
MIKSMEQNTLETKGRSTSQEINENRIFITTFTRAASEPYPEPDEFSSHHHSLFT